MKPGKSKNPGENSKSGPPILISNRRRTRHSREIQISQSAGEYVSTRSRMSQIRTGKAKPDIYFRARAGKVLEEESNGEENLKRKKTAQKQ